MEGLFLKEGKRLVRVFDYETLWIEPWGDNSLRVRSTMNKEMDDTLWALLPVGEQVSTIEIKEKTASIQNGKIKAEINEDGFITFTNQKGEILLKEYYQGFPLKIPGREWKPQQGDTYRLKLRFEANKDERIYGMGQYQQENLNLKGCTLELAHRNSQASVPFYVSKVGYGFLWHNPGYGQVVFGENRTEWVAESTKQLDYWITAGDQPSEIEEAYAHATGTVPMMPDYGMGFWQCKLRYQTQEELLEVARAYKRRGLPISVIVIDFFHWPEQGDWRFDLKYWPDPKAMVAELKEMEIELMVSVWPTVDYRSENFVEMQKKGYLTRTEHGMRVSMSFLGNTLFYDATKPAARDYVWQTIKKNYYDYGIKLFWLDEAEPEYVVYEYDNYRYEMGPSIQVGNIYPQKYAQTFYEGMEGEGQKQIINLIRCAWAGSQRYGALAWSGDLVSTFVSLKHQVRAGLNMGMAGIPWWTTDIGGFFNGNIHDEGFHELLIRWFQYGTFSPVFRLHGDRLPHQEPMGTSGGSMCPSGADNEVWSFGEEVYEILQSYMWMRERMKPYITQVMAEAHEKGTPVMRPLFYEFPKDEQAWKVEDSYLFGPDLLIAPILEAGLRERQVYLPEGVNWIHIFTNKVYKGGQWITCAAPIEEIPIFQREGSKWALESK